jgi:hypothetical protein
LGENVLQRKIRVCGTMKPKRGIPDLKRTAKKITKKSPPPRKGDILVQISKNNQVVCMSSTIHEKKFVNPGKKDKRDWRGNKEVHLYCRTQYICEECGQGQSVPKLFLYP